jgi:predicted DNA-binding transcriptional regulator AlpA
MADILYTQDLAKKLNTTEAAVRNHVQRRSKNFPMPFKLGRKNAWRTKDIDSWLNNQKPFNRA